MSCILTVMYYKQPAEWKGMEMEEKSMLQPVQREVSLLSLLEREDDLVKAVNAGKEKFGKITSAYEEDKSRHVRECASQWAFEVELDIKIKQEELEKVRWEIFHYLSGRGKEAE